MASFLYKLSMFVWIEQGCLANKMFVLDPGNSVIKVVVYLCSGQVLN